MQNMFIAKGNLGDSPELQRVNGRHGEFVVASIRVMFARWPSRVETSATWPNGPAIIDCADVGESISRQTHAIVLG